MPTVAVDGGQLWYETRGTGPPLVLLHGGWMDSDAWAPQITHFADRYRVIRPDLRGHGRTGGTDERHYSIDLLTDDLERLLDHLDVDRPTLCGLSLGSLVVQSYLDRHPTTTAAAVLGGSFRTMPPLAGQGWLPAWPSPTMALRSVLSVAGSKTTFRTFLGAIRAVEGGPWLSTSRDVRARAIETAGDMSRTEYSKVFAAMYQYAPPILSGVATPTLAVYGREESPLLKRQGCRIAATVENGAVAAVPDAAHLVNLDNPAAFNAAVGSFLAETGAS